MKRASVHISQLIISSFCLPMVAEEDLDVMGYWVVQVFRQTNTSGFLLFPLERGKWDTSRLPNTPRVSPFTIEPGRATHWETRKRWKTNSYWSESFGKRLVLYISQLVSTPQYCGYLPKKRWIGNLSVWLHKNFEDLPTIKGWDVKIFNVQVHVSSPNLGLISQITSRQI